MAHRTLEKLSVSKQLKISKQSSAETDLKHYKTPPSALVLPELDEGQDPLAALNNLRTEDLYLRAKAVPIRGAELQTREDLIKSLAAYHRWQTHLEPELGEL